MAIILGPWLRSEREGHGINLEDVYRCTRIRVHYLVAIEQGKFEELPRGVIGRGFFRAYLQAIGIDNAQAAKIHALACAANEERQDSPLPTEPWIKQYSERLMSLSPWFATALLLATYFLSVILALQWRGHYRVTPKEVLFAANASSRVSSADLQQLRNAQAFKAYLSSRQLADGKITSRSEDVSVIPGAFQRNIFTLSIRVRQDAWILVIADGRPVLSETLAPPAEALVEAHTQILVRAGNVGAVDFSFDGESLPTQGEYDQAKTLTFNSHGLQIPAPRILFPSFAPATSIEPRNR